MPGGCSTFEGACRSRFARVNTSGLIKSFASARTQGVIAPSGAQAPSGRQWLTRRIEGDANSCRRYFRSCFFHSASYAWGPLWARAIARRRPGHARYLRQPLDPIITRGFRVSPWFALSTIIGACLFLLRLRLGWPSWVTTIGDFALIGGLLLTLLLGSVIGFRVAVEEARVSADDRGQWDDP